MTDHITNDFPTEVRPAPRDITGRLRVADRQTNTLTIRVSKEQYDRITAAADRAQLSVNQWCKVTLMRKADK